MVLANAVNSKVGLQYLASTGIFSTITDGTSTQVLIGGTPPSFTSYPQIVGLGLGASPGSTAGLTFDGSNFLNAYATSTFTPTLDGAVSGTTTYTAQNGYYTKIGNLVWIVLLVQGTAATGTGNVTVGGLPFTVKNQTNGNIVTSGYSNVAQTYVVGTTQIDAVLQINTTTSLFQNSGTASAGGNLQMANVAFNYRISGSYQV